MKTKSIFILVFIIVFARPVNSQTWVTNTVGGTPAMYLTSTTYNLGLGMATTTSTNPYKLYAVGSSRFTNGTGYIDLIPGGPASLEIGSSSVVYSQIDFKGFNNLGSDYRGRIQYSDGGGFYTYTAGNSLPSFVILDGGNVGVGITNPTFKLQTIGSSRFQNSTTGTIGSIDLVPAGSSTTPSSIEIASGGTATSSQIDFKGYTNLASDFYGRIKYTDGSGFAFQTGGSTTNKVVINENGEVGIGTSPSTGNTLDILGYNIRLQYNAYSYATLSSVPGCLFLAGPGGGISPFIGFGDDIDVSNSTDARILYTDADGLTISTGGISNSRMRIKPDGKVIIGNPSTVTSPSGYLLFVDEGILTEKVKVALCCTTDWSDFVFNPDYEMLSLDSVEKFVNANCHLPGVPSADEIVKEGIDVAKMDALLLQKIEELTLYMIELRKENDELKNEIEQLKKK